MQTPARTLRAEEDDHSPRRDELTQRDRDRRGRILDSATRLMARHGRNTIGLGNFALALRVAPGAVRRLFTDLDSLLAEILHRHLQDVSKAVGEVPHDAPNLHAARRAAYVKATRTAFGAPTDAQLLMTRDRHLLPPDLREPLEDVRRCLGQVLDNDFPDAALALVDLPQLEMPQIEAALGAMPRGAALVRPGLQADPPPQQATIEAPVPTAAGEEPPESGEFEDSLARLRPAGLPDLAHQLIADNALRARAGPRRAA